MTVMAVVGAQWGDEGKGRVVDWLAQDADLVIRYQGGDNAGHTVVNDLGTFKLHILPSGIFNPATRCVVGAGAVVNPTNLLAEIAGVEAEGVDTSNLWLSERSHVVMPYHVALDGMEEEARSKGARIGTTKRGIGPVYTDKASRIGIRLGDLARPEWLRHRLEVALDRANRLLGIFGHAPFDLEEMMALAAGWAAALGPRIIDTLPMVRRVVQGGGRVVLEGQLGVMRDLDWGMYPYVTSSNPTAAYAGAGAGLPATAIDRVIGVVKAYTTSVGGGPLPTEQLNADGDRLREVGKEYGATTGRPRRCGWFDGAAIAHATWLNGFTSLAITKLDVLDDFAEIKLGVAYLLDGKPIEGVPDTPDLARVRPVWETMPGWQSSTRDAKRWSDLPEAAQRYLERISELAGAPIRFVSVGPERERLVVIPGDWS